MNLIAPAVRGPVRPLRSSPAETAEPANTTPLVRQYLRIAFRWRFIIIGVTVACFLLGLIATLLMTPKYTALATVEISRESAKVTDLQGVEREASVADQEFYQTQYGLLKSRVLSERVAMALNLVDDRKFFELFGVGEGEVGFQVVNGRYVASGRAERLRRAGMILDKHVDVTPARLSRLVDIGFTSPDPAFSAKVANSWADNFIRMNLERKIQATSYGRDLLQRQLGQLKQKLDESQRQLVSYASDQRIINLPQQASDGKTTAERSIVADDLAALNAALSQATADRIQAEARYQQAGRAGSSTEALRNVAINSLRERRTELAAEYQKLMTQFEPGYPAAQAIARQIAEIDRGIAREEGRISSSLSSGYREAVERERALQSKVDQLKSSFLDQRRRSIQYNIYQQEVDTNRALYDGLLQRFKEIGVAGGVGVNNISIVDPAEVPRRPSSPRLLLNLLLSLVAGIGLGAITALILEQIDEAIADPTEIEALLGLPLLGSVPKLAEGTPKAALLDRKSEMVDAYLAIQTSLQFTTEHGVPRSLAVTSTRPAEGKSTTAIAIATMLARAQKRVILIDGDMRSPSVHHLGGVDHDRGLSNFLSGEDDIDSLTFHMQDMGITAMSAGPIPPNAAELLTGSRLQLLVERLLGVFDHVVIDSPPVMGLADAPLIASRVEAVVFAIESHGIRTSMVRTALSRLANAHIVGGVLTKFEARKASYGYGYEYGYGYGRAEADAR